MASLQLILLKFKILSFVSKIQCPQKQWSCSIASIRHVESRVPHSQIKYYFGEGEESGSKIMRFQSFSKNPIIKILCKKRQPLKFHLFFATTFKEKDNYEVIDPDGPGIMWIIEL